MTRAPAESLAESLVERVLAKLDLQAAPSTDLAGLAGIYDAWCRRVPFDNVLKRIHIEAEDPGPLPGSDPSAFFEDWLEHGTGGTCWAGNGALAVLLASLGFDAKHGVGTMLVAPDIPPNHGTVSVAFDSSRYLVDASLLFCEPLPIVDAKPVEVGGPAMRVRLSYEDGFFHVRWHPFHVDEMDCRIETFSGSAEIFDERYEATRAFGPFNFQLSARRVVDDRMIGVSFGNRAEIDSAGNVELALLEGPDRIAFLVDQLGISEAKAHQLPPDRTSPAQ